VPLALGALFLAATLAACKPKIGANAGVGPEAGQLQKVVVAQWGTEKYLIYLPL